ncbi:MAG: MFS transporter, partial [Nitrospirae bacterium]|nr:MFS transporter [Nitrospirota bacterium]
LVGIVTQPIVGALSDRARSRWGRRVPFLIAGVLTAIVGYAGSNQPKEVLQIHKHPRRRGVENCMLWEPTC